MEVKTRKVEQNPALGWSSAAGEKQNKIHYWLLVISQTVSQGRNETKIFLKEGNCY